MSDLTNTYTYPHTVRTYKKEGNMPKLRKKLIELPLDVHDIFKTIDNTFERDIYITALREVGWTLDSIGKATELSRERVRQIVAATPITETDYLIPSPPLMPERPRPVYTEPSPETLATLLELQPFAQQVRSNSPKFREEAEKYTALINHAHVVDGVPLYRLAKRLGVTNGALRFRLARYGYMVPANGTSKVYAPIVERNRIK